MAVINPVGYLHNVQTHTAQIDRLASATGLLFPDAVGSLRPIGGLRHPSDCALTAVGAMVVRVGPGIVYVGQGQSSLGGGYAVPNDGNIDIVIATAHATLTRWDLIVARVRDSFYAGTDNFGEIIVIPGTAASSPSDPALPAGYSYQVLGRVIVGPGVSTITQSNVIPLAPSAGVVGTPYRCTSTTRPTIALYDGFPIYETDTKAFAFWDKDRGGTGVGGWLHFDTKWQDYTPAIATSSPANVWTQGNGVAVGRYMRAGKRIHVEGQVTIGSTSTYGAGASGAILVRPPTGYRPYAWTPNQTYSLPMPGGAFLANGGAAFGYVVSLGSATPADRWFSFYQTGATALTGNVGSAGSWNMWASGHALMFSCIYDTAFEA